MKVKTCANFGQSTIAVDKSGVWSIIERFPLNSTHTAIGSRPNRFRLETFRVAIVQRNKYIYEQIANIGQHNTGGFDGSVRR